MSLRNLHEFFPDVRIFSSTYTIQANDIYVGTWRDFVEDLIHRSYSIWLFQRQLTTSPLPVDVVSKLVKADKFLAEMFRGRALSSRADVTPTKTVATKILVSNLRQWTLETYAMWFTVGEWSLNTRTLLDEFIGFKFAVISLRHATN